MKVQCAACKECIESGEATRIEGLGQLCEKCYRKVAEEKERIDLAIAQQEAKKHSLVPLDPNKTYEEARCEKCFKKWRPIGTFLGMLVYKCMDCDLLFKKD